ncbi:hypothetical protein ACFYN5_36215 [Streptomyces sp. NPDC007126]|uniref:hypothetical protein n=1 Tax=Streptomyces sp. NPDC007126 TaxID=3364774 RepID=UPI0036C20767
MTIAPRGPSPSWSGSSPTRLGERARCGGGSGSEKWQTLSEALDNPDGERLYRMEEDQSRRRQAERKAAEREAQRPVCTRCGTKFTDERWQSVIQTSWRSTGDNLCRPCQQEDVDREEAERAARREAEEAAAREAAEADAKKGRGLFGPRPVPATRR